MGAFPLYANESEKEIVQAVLNQWIRGINQKELTLVMATYDSSFGSDGRDYAHIQSEFQQYFEASSSISTEIYSPEIVIDHEQARIGFVQLTHTDQLSDIGRKSMTLVKQEGQWKIHAESFESLVGYLRLSPEDKIDLSLTDLGRNPEKIGNDSNGIPIRSSEQFLTVRGIKYQLVKKGVESVCLECDRRFRPVVQGMEGETPKIVIELFSVADFKGPAQVPLKTGIIKSIRTNYDSPDRTLQVALEIAPGGNYTVEPVYFDMLNTFCVAVKAPGVPALLRTDKPKPTITIEKPE